MEWHATVEPNMCQGVTVYILTWYCPADNYTYQETYATLIGAQMRMNSVLGSGRADPAHTWIEVHDNAVAGN